MISCIKISSKTSARAVFLLKPIEDFQVGDKIVQSFSMFDEQILFKFTGEIVRIDQKGIGVKFTNLTPYQMDMLKSLMEKNRK